MQWKRFSKMRQLNLISIAAASLPTTAIANLPFARAIDSASDGILLSDFSQPDNPINLRQSSFLKTYRISARRDCGIQLSISPRTRNRLRSCRANSWGDRSTTVRALLRIDSNFAIVAVDKLTLSEQLDDDVKAAIKAVLKEPYTPESIVNLIGKV